MFVIINILKNVPVNWEASFDGHLHGFNKGMTVQKKFWTSVKMVLSHI